MVAYRILRPDDANVLAMLHAATFTVPWSPAALRGELAKPSALGMALLLPDEDTQIISFVLFQRVGDTAEMLTLATAPMHQKQGHARALLRAGFDHLRERGVTRCLLDVAADNRAAIVLYLALGFKEDGWRKNYYKRPGQRPVDAILMSKSFRSAD